MANLTWKYVKPLSNSNAVEDFEKDNHITIPQDLKQCIKDNNGGRPSLNVFDTNKSRDRVFKTLLSFNKADKETIFSLFPSIHSEHNGLIPFASDPGGNYLCIQGTKIVLFLHENETLEDIADSFSELLLKLH